jgi:hypothetical protein
MFPNLRVLQLEAVESDAMYPRIAIARSPASPHGGSLSVSRHQFRRQATASHLTSVIAENKSKPTSLSPVIKAQKESRQRTATTDNNPGNSRSRFRFPTCMHAPPTVKKIPSCCIWENLPSRTCIDQPTLTRGLRFFSGREDCVALCALVRLFQIVHDLRKTECGSPR